MNIPTFYFTIYNCDLAHSQLIIALAICVRVCVCVCVCVVVYPEKGRVGGAGWVGLGAQP